MVSRGFSNLFTLRKEDLESTLEHYPVAKRILNAKTKKLMKEIAAKEKKEKPGKAEDEMENVMFR